ncbi:M24 family metallopeptidase [Pendulispora albinea]|uniref:M24 family metallopeptidase n=1 Tax=Pendulispora albinea TaxID=2741071 RepID=A0ABZ2M880_9BACT
MDQDLEQFRAVQRLAYDCAEAVGASLRPGVTERDAAAAMRTWLLGRGVDDWLHRPFVWFGDRTAFEGVRLPHHFFPTNRRLEANMPYILDVAPVVNGYAADIGYAGCLGTNPVHEQLLRDLEAYRALILEGVRARRSFRAIYREVDGLLAQQGHKNRHRRYPLGVLAHRIEHLPMNGPRWTVAGFGLRSLRSLLGDAMIGTRAGWSPFWGPSRLSDHPPAEGLWAVEPHLGHRGVGVKFEELLVITKDDAFWLDDDLPHVRRWRWKAAA